MVIKNGPDHSFHFRVLPLPSTGPRDTLLTAMAVGFNDSERFRNTDIANKSIAAWWDGKGGHVPNSLDLNNVMKFLS